MIHWLYQGLILRMAGSAVLSFGIVMVMGPRMIRFLIRKKLGDRPEFDRADLNELTRQKSSTPTMGGILIAIAIFAAIIVFADLKNFYIRMALVVHIFLKPPKRHKDGQRRDLIGLQSKTAKLWYARDHLYGRSKKDR